MGHDILDRAASSQDIPQKRQDVRGFLHDFTSRMQLRGSNAAEQYHATGHPAGPVVASNSNKRFR